MKTKLAIILTLINLAFYSLSEAIPAKVGENAPDFKASGALKGEEHQLSSYKGKFVVLEWFNKDCPYVKKHYNSGNMQKLQKDYTQKGVVWLTLISSAPGKQGYLTTEEAKKVYNEKQAGSTDVLIDAEGTIGTLYGAKTTPHMFIINPEGKLIYNGAIDDTPSSDSDDIAKSKNYVVLALTQSMTGKPVTQIQTKPYGCSVKYK